MNPRPPTDCRQRLVQAATQLMRRDGFAAASVDAICREAGVTKGAFFHHFPSKEAVAEASLQNWLAGMAALEQRAEFQSADDPLERLAGFLDFYTELLSDPAQTKSCLAGATVQEVAETHPALRAAANACFTAGQQRLAALIAAAADARGVQLDAMSLAGLWVVAVQGALLVYKASRDEAVITSNLTHVKRYLMSCLDRR